MRLGTPRSSILAVLLIPFLLLPNFAFLVSLASAETPPAVVGQPPGTSLPPGSVASSAYSPMPLTCPASVAGSQPLLPTSGTWSTSLRIPYSTFNGAANDAFLTQYFTVYQNGTFLASDDKGNRFETASPILGLLGSAKTSLRSNATAAVQTTLLSLGSHTVANVTLTFSVYRVACQPAGVRVVASGGASWGAPGEGAFSLPFKTKPTSVSGYTAWFGHYAKNNFTNGNRQYQGNDTQALGFDWSDSKGLSPAFNSITNALSWPVGPTFLIDPSTVASTSSSEPISGGYEGHVCFAQSLYWVFYYDGTSEGYRTSNNYGSTWSSETTIPVSYASPDAVSFACSGNEVAYVSGTGALSDTLKTFYYRFGKLENDSVIGWNMTVEASHSSTYTAPVYVQVAFDSSNNLWFQLDTYKPTIVNGKPQDFGTSYAEVWEGTSCGASGCTLTDSLNVVNAFPGVLVPLTLGKMALVYENFNCGTDVMFYSNPGWGSSAVTGGSCNSHYDLLSSGYTAMNDTVEVGFNDPTASAQGYISVPYNSSTPVWGTPTTIESDSGGTTGISADNSTTLVMYIGHSTTVNEYTSSDSGATWGNATALSTTEPASVSDMDAIPQFYGNSSVVWAAGSTIRFQDPLSPPSPTWGMAGYSPYESYFGDLQVHVSAGSGLLGVSQTDLSLPGRGMDMDIARVFSEPLTWYWPNNHLLPYPFKFDSYPLANLGYGWSLDFPWLGTYSVHLYGGQTYLYAWPSSTSTSWTNRYVADFTLTRTSSSGSGAGTCPCTLTLADGEVDQFNAAKQLISITDQTKDNVVTFTYGSNGYISTITDTVGRVVTFAYTSGMLTSITSGGRVWTYAYTSGNLVSVTDPANRVTTFGYDPNSYDEYITSIGFASGGGTALQYASLTWSTAGGTWWHYTVSLENLLLSSTDPTSIVNSTSFSYGLSPIGHVIAWDHATISDGSTTQGYVCYTFTSSSSTAKTYGLGGTPCSASTLLGGTTTTLDSSRRAGKVQTLGSNGVKATDYIGHDDWGNVVFTYDGVTGERVWYSYANAGSSNTFSYAYLKAHIPFSSGYSSCGTAFLTGSPPAADYSDPMGVCTSNSAGQMETFYAYDSYGNLVKQNNLHNGAFLTMTYTGDKYGNRLKMTDANQHVTNYFYSTLYGSAYLTSESSGYVSSSYSYNFTTGYMTSSTDADHNTFSYAYDSVGRVTQVVTPGETVSYTYTDVPGSSSVSTTISVPGIANQTTTESFDGLGRMTSECGYYSCDYYWYNYLGLVSIHQLPSEYTVGYTHDILGRPTSITYQDDNVTTISYNGATNAVTVKDANGHSVVYGYDWDNQLTTVKQYYASGSYYTTSYSYDGSGNLLSTKDAKGHTTSYAYDDLNRLTKVTLPGGQYESLAYDSVGNVISSRSFNSSTTTYAYDYVNRLNQTTYPGSGGTVSISHDGNGNEIRVRNQYANTVRTFNWAGDVTSEKEILTIPGTPTKTLADSFGYTGSDLTSLTYPDNNYLSMTYDFQNRLTGISSSAGSVASFDYTLDSMAQDIYYGSGGSVTSYAYDSMDRVTSITDAYAGLSLTYHYDKVGNVESLAVGGTDETFGYNWLNELTTASGPWGSSVAYTYDGAGNMLTLKNGTTTTTYGYNSNNQLTSVNGVTTGYSYDPDGNMLSNGVWTYKYNYADEMTKTYKSGTLVQTNYYDGDGRRVAQTTAQGTVLYAYQGSTVLCEDNVASGAWVDHVYGDGMQVAQIVNNIVYYVMPDGLGSVRLVMSSSGSGSTTFSSDYAPFGQSYGTAGTQLQTQTSRYIGQPYDSATGLYYLGARFYDPAIGRFITQDTYGGSLSDLLSLNRYIYAADNPMTLSDPAGHFSWTTVALIGAVVGLTVVSALQLGLDPATDALDAVSISGLTASVASGGAVAVGAVAIAQGGEGAVPEAGTIISDEIPNFLDLARNDFPSGGEARILVNYISGPLIRFFGGEARPVGLFWTEPEVEPDQLGLPSSSTAQRVISAYVLPGSVFIEGPTSEGATQFFFILRNLVIGSVAEVG